MGKSKISNCEIIDEPPCLFCGGRHFKLLFSALDFDSGEESFKLIECRNCHLVRTEPVLSESQLTKYYTLPYYGGGKEKFKGLTENLTRWFNDLRAGSILSSLLERRRPSANTPPRILDIGCGRGNLLRILNQKGCDCYGIERREFPVDSQSKEIHFYQGSLKEIFFTEGFFDAVILWHVLEHMEDPLSVIKETSRILRPGGILAIAVPNFGSFQAKLFRNGWFHLDLPRHIYHFYFNTLFQCLDLNGFKVLKKSTFSIEQNPFGFIQSLFNKIVPLAKPNRFYSMLKKTNNTPPSTPILLFWVGLASLVFPLALLEYLLSGLLGQGATLIIYAEKS